MKFVKFLSILSIVISLIIAFSNPVVRQQTLTFDFPLTALGEGVLIMVLPIFFSVIALILSLIILVMKREANVLILPIVSWLIIWVILGNKGFRYIL